MNIRLDPRSEHLIEQQLRAGRFNTPEEVVARALETLAGEETARLEENDRPKWRTIYRATTSRG